MPDGSWVFEEVGPMGGATADAFRNTLAGAGKPLAELLAREAIQNSWDARLPQGAGKVRVRMESRTFEGPNLEGIRQRLGLVDPKSAPLSRPGLLATSDQQGDLRAGLRGPLHALLIEDFGTVGLGGTADGKLPQTEEDKYFRLCMELGGTESQASGRGGTFGYGKAVYWAASSLWTVLFYSSFRPTVRSERASRRLIGVSWFRGHNFEGRRYTGRAWWGDRKTIEGAEIPVPFIDDDADRLAALLGFRVRGSPDTGLSLMILGCDVDITRLRVGAEKWWWPRLLGGDLEVDFGDSTSPIEPRSNPRLYQYVRAWDLLTGDIKPTEDDNCCDRALHLTGVS